MKFIKFITHPIATLISFSAILINGESMGGPYLYYIAMALPHGSLHSLLAVAGAILIILNPVARIRLLLHAVGVWLLYTSLFIFFYRSWTYNDQTFESVIPIFTFVIFILTSFGLLAADAARHRRPSIH